MQTGLSALDWAVVAGYFGVVLAVGLRASAGSTATLKDHFLARSSLPWWAVTLSIIAAETSAVTYIGTPRIAFEGDWSFLQLVLGFCLGRVFLGAFLVPALTRDDVLTVYAWLERRFGNAARVASALLFLLGRVVGSGVRLYAGCLAVEIATGLPLRVSIVGLGMVALCYTLVGGIRSVIWTDVLLGVTFLGGGLAAALHVLTAAPGGAGAILADPELPDKLTVFRGGWSLSDANSLLAGLAGGFFLTLATHGTDQDVVQRVLACRGRRGGSLSIYGSAAMILPVMALFLAVGTLLWAWYRASPPSYPLPANGDHIFPLFIVRELPAGLAGFVMAGLFAAAISSCASVLNALAATAATDFYAPIRSALGLTTSERNVVRFSRGAIVVWGAVLVLVALGFQGSSDGVLAMALKVLTYFYGSLLGALLLAAFARRGNGRSVVAGMVLAVLVVALLQVRQFLDRPDLAPTAVRAAIERTPSSWAEALRGVVPPIAWPWWIVVGTAVSFGVGWLGARRESR